MKFLLKQHEKNRPLAKVCIFLHFWGKGERLKGKGTHNLYPDFCNKSNLLEKVIFIHYIYGMQDDLMTIRIEVQANTQDKFDLNSIHNAIEERLDEMDIQASTRLE